MLQPVRHLVALDPGLEATVAAAAREALPEIVVAYQDDVYGTGRAAECGLQALPADLHGKRVHAVKRVGKRIAIGVDGGLWSVVHLMIAGRLHWSDKYKRPDGRRTLAAWVFENGCLTLTEAGSQKRAALHITTTPDALDAGGIDVLAATAAGTPRTTSRE